MKNGRSRLVLVAGGAGFLGSHLCDALLADGDRVLCIDNFLTGRRRNLRHLEREPRFDLIEADVIDPLPSEPASPRLTLDAIFNLACPASPPHYQADPEHTMLTNVLGTRNLLRLAERRGARFLLASTSEVYGDPDVHPQQESLLGQRQPDRPARLLRRGQARRRGAGLRLSTAPAAPRCASRASSTPMARACGRMTAASSRTSSRRRSPARTSRSTATARRRAPSATCDDLVDGLMRLMRYDGAPRGPVNLGNPNELTVGELVERVVAHDRIAVADRQSAAAGRRSAPAAARHQPGEGASRLDAQGVARGRPQGDDPLVCRRQREGTGAGEQSG